MWLLTIFFPKNSLRYLNHARPCTPMRTGGVCIQGAPFNWIIEQPVCSHLILCWEKQTMIHMKKSICSEATGCYQIASVTKVEHYLPHPNMSKKMISQKPAPLGHHFLYKQPLFCSSGYEEEENLISCHLKLKLFPTCERLGSFKLAICKSVLHFSPFQHLFC